MTEIDISVVSGQVRSIAVPATAVDVTILSGASHLCGWSLRDASGDMASDIEGSVVTPTAGQAIATSAAQSAGVYTVKWTVTLAGTLSTQDTNNFGLYAGSTLIATSVSPPGGGVYPQPDVQMTLTQGQTYSIKAIGAGTAASTYSASASAVPESGAQTAFEIRDTSYPVGEGFAIPGAASTQHFGQAGIKIRGALNLHIISGSVSGSILVRYAQPGDYRLCSLT
jgi:hypothetical protein